MSATAQLSTMPPERAATIVVRGRAFNVVRIVLGVLLLTAAGLKLYGLNVTALPRVGWFSTPQVQVLAAEWELILGLWLLSGTYRFGAWAAALATFSTFAVVSGYFGWIGVASCGCFGVIRTSPWTAFAVDLAAVGLLLVFRPTRSRLSRGTSSADADSAPGPAQQAGRMLIAAIAVLIALTAAGSWYYGSPAAALAHLREESLTVEPSYVDFGSGKPRDVIERQVTVYNWTDQPVRIVGGTSDCSCTTLNDLPLTAAANGSVSVMLRMRVPASKGGLLGRTAELWTDNQAQRVIRVKIGCQVLK